MMIMMMMTTVDNNHCNGDNCGGDLVIVTHLDPTIR